MKRAFSARQNKYFLWIPVVAAVLAIWFWMVWSNLFHGHHPTDDGYILSLAWRVYNGQIPFRDFIYLRPPLPAFLHSLWFWLAPENAFVLGRLSFYLWMGASLALPLWVLVTSLNDNIYKQILIVLCSVSAWLYAVHNFPTMPWHTVDGLLFATLAVVSLTRVVLDSDKSGSRSAWIWIGSLAAGLAVLAKQNFATLPLWYGMGFLLFVPQRRDLRNIIFVWGLLALPSFVLVCVLMASGALTAAIQQIGSASQAGALWGAGFEPYLRPQSLPLVAIAATLGWFAARSRWVLLGLLPSLLLVLGFSELSFHNNIFRSCPVFLALVVWQLSFFWGLNAAKALDWKTPWPRAMVTLLSGGAVTAWSAAVSWGYPVPLLGFGLVGFGCAALAFSRNWKMSELRAAAAIAMVILVFNMLAYDRATGTLPYRDVPRNQQSLDLSRVFSRFGPRLLTNPETFHRYSSLHEVDLWVKQNRPATKLVVMPEFPLFYYLSGRMNPVAMEWWLPSDFLGQEGRLLNEISRPGIIVALEHRQSGCASPVYPTAISTAVMKGFRQVQAIGNFCLMEAF